MYNNSRLYIVFEHSNQCLNRPKYTSYIIPFWLRLSKPFFQYSPSSLFGLHISMNSISSRRINHGCKSRYHPKQEAAGSADYTQMTVSYQIAKLHSTLPNNAVVLLFIEIMLINHNSRKAESYF